MLGEEFGHLGLDRLGQQGARSVAQHLGKRVGERPWLKQLDDVSIGHGVSLLCWRSGGSNTPTIRRLLPVRPSPTFAHSSSRTNAEASGTTNSSCEEPGVAAHQMTAVGRLRQLNRGPANGWIRRIEVIVPRVGNWPEMAPQQTLVR